MHADERRRSQINECERGTLRNNVIIRRVASTADVACFNLSAIDLDSQKRPRVDAPAPHRGKYSAHHSVRCEHVNNYYRLSTGKDFRIY
ncbi:hypothetical protein EVAR_54005_1 [Eumeta japonica]|uniref:Uncharacterized protein n=1 Tax=Eumeta variegata TaxID=151549 RepID=A0A4C1YSQ3_EUMVA|nr:hypothetical protein EVAR_54005_1 [Eumeta japonica]